MQFALLGDHPDGLGMAAALVASGRHHFLAYSGPVSGLPALHRFQPAPRIVGDLEEVLADSDIEAVIVAVGSSLRAAYLRRALQSEHHVLCVHPADPSPDVAYEAALIQGDTGRVLLPLLPMTFHPGIARLADLSRQWPFVPVNPPLAQSSLGGTRLLELEIWGTEEIVLGTDGLRNRPGLPGWDVLRFVGGEISEVFLLSSAAALAAGQTCLVSGRFQNGGLYQATYLPNQASAQLRLALVTTTGRATLHFSEGWPGPSLLSFADEQGVNRVEQWEAFHPWMRIVERFEEAVLETTMKRQGPGKPAEESLTKPTPRLGWLDELRGLELNEAVRRSAERGRSNTLDLQEATEEASFKGTMTLLGCSLIWLSLIVLILATWIPWLAWLILPVFGVFLIMQVVRLILPSHGR